MSNINKIKEKSIMNIKKKYAISVDKNRILFFEQFDEKNHRRIRNAGYF